MLDLQKQKFLNERLRKRLKNTKSEVESAYQQPSAGNSPQPKKWDDNTKPLGHSNDNFAIYYPTIRTYSSDPESFLPARLRSIEKVNLEIHERLLNAKAKVNSHQVDNNFRLNNKRYGKKKLKKPTAHTMHEMILEKYKDVYQPQDEDVLRRLQNPTIYFDIAHGVQKLGRIVIELCTEACPEIVLEFVRACRMQNVDSFRLERSFPNLCLECQLYLKNDGIQSTNIPFDLRALGPGIEEGILSLPLANLRGAPKDSIPFTISYKPLQLASGNRLAFGKVIAGLENLNFSKDNNCIKYGKPIKNLKLKECGILP